MQITRFHPGPRYSQTVVHGDTIYLCGQSAEDEATNVTDQTRIVLERIDKLLAEQGSSKSKLLQVQVWLADMKDYDAMNAVWDAWVDPNNTPGRATLAASMPHNGLLVEVIVIAAK